MNEQKYKVSVIQLPDGHCIRRTSSKIYEKATAINLLAKGKPTTWAVLSWFYKDEILTSATFSELARAGKIWGAQVELMDVIDKDTLWTEN